MIEGAITRPARWGDIPELGAMWDALLEHLAKIGAREAAPREAYENAMANVLAERWPGAIVVVVVGGQIVAAAMATKDETRTGFERPARGWGHYVRPEFRGKGYTELLANELERQLKVQGFRTLVGQVALENAASRKFFRRRGWKPHAFLAHKVL